MAARKKDWAKAYLRRSTGKQEASLWTQLEWAIEKALELGVRLDASLADLEYMLAHGLDRYKDIYLDDGITGSDLQRPGFAAFRAAAMADERVSHLLVHMADRFARPEMAHQAMQMEVELLYAGLTVVFSNRVSQLRVRGRNYFGEDVLILYAYTESGEFLNKLAVRMVEVLTKLARDGYWPGGRPPYGFIRILVDALGKEICEMEDGTSIRREGCHTRIKPKDMAKIAVWLRYPVPVPRQELGRQAHRLPLERTRHPLPGRGAGADGQRGQAQGERQVESRHGPVADPQ
jgi:DNA invertase Pin-like site-specific DNA recombinase